MWNSNLRVSLRVSKFGGLWLWLRKAWIWKSGEPLQLWGEIIRIRPSLEILTTTICKEICSWESGPSDSWGLLPSERAWEFNIFPEFNKYVLSLGFYLSQAEEPWGVLCSSTLWFLWWRRSLWPLQVARSWFLEEGPCSRCILVSISVDSEVDSLLRQVASLLDM